MKRMPLLATVLALVALSASIAYWVMQLNPPPTRPLASAPLAVAPPPSVDAAATLFGGQVATAVVTNYVLTGVIASGAQGVAIIVADGGLPKALKIGRELAPGITLNEVYSRYVTLLDNGITKRIDLAAEVKSASNLPGAMAAPMMPQQPAPMVTNVTVPNEPPMAPGAVQGQPNMMAGQQQQPQQPMPSGPSPANPGAVQGSTAPTQPSQVQIPPPARNFATPATMQ